MVEAARDAMFCYKDLALKPSKSGPFCGHAIGESVLIARGTITL